MEKTKMKPIEVWRVGIQNGANCGYNWTWSPEFPSFDAIITAYHDWFIAHPMRRIQFRKETKFIPA